MVPAARDYDVLQFDFVQYRQDLDQEWLGGTPEELLERIDDMTASMRIIARTFTEIIVSRAAAT